MDHESEINIFNNTIQYIHHVWVTVAIVQPPSNTATQQPYNNVTTGSISFYSYGLKKECIWLHNF